jgi:hypothetical protein
MKKRQKIKLFLRIVLRNLSAKLAIVSESKQRNLWDYLNED